MGYTSARVEFKWRVWREYMKLALRPYAYNSNCPFSRNFHHHLFCTKNIIVLCDNISGKTGSSKKVVSVSAKKKDLVVSTSVVEGVNS